MSTSSVKVGVFDHVIAHLSGDVRLNVPPEYHATALAAARATRRVAAAVARTSPASRSTSLHAPGS